MTSFTIFYLSRVIRKKVFDNNFKFIGIVKDLLVDPDSSNHSLGRQLVNGISIKCKNMTMFCSFQHFQGEKTNGKLMVICNQLVDMSSDISNSNLYLAESIPDKQTVDINGHKLVRVNDVRLVSIATDSSNDVLQGMVVIDEVIEDLITKRRTNK